MISSLALPGGEAAEVYSIHPFPPNSGFAVSGLERYLDAIPAAAPSGPPRLLIGDFNATLDSAAFRELLGRGYTDTAAASGEGLSWTWPQKLIPPPVAIDHSVVDERVEVLDHQTAELPGSDHRATISALRLPATVAE